MTPDSDFRVNARRFLLRGAVVLLAAVSIRAQLPLAPNPLLPMAIQVQALTPDQPQVEAPFLVDSTVTRIYLDVRATAPGLEVSLQAPNSQTVTAGTVAGLGGEYAYFHVERDASLFGMMMLWSPGHHYVYRLPALGAGSYTVRVASGAGVTEPVALVLEFSTDSTRISPDTTVDTKMSLDAPGMAAILDQPNRMVVSARDGDTPVTGSVVTVEIRPEGGAATTISLLDDGEGADSKAGDGLYSGWFTPRTAGDYEATADIQLPPRYQDPVSVNVPPGAAATATRLEFAHFPVVRQGGKLTGRIEDSGLDEDGDKRFDKIVFDVEVEVEEAGEYAVRLLLGKDGVPDQDFWGRGGHGSAVLAPGLRTVRVPLTVSDLRKSGHDSPYQVRQVLLRNSGSQGNHVVSMLENAGQTKTYGAHQLQKPRIAVTGAVSDRGVDDDGDGLFDWLVVSVPLDIRTDYRHYSWQVDLTTASGERILTAFGSWLFDFEQNIAELKFDGGRIRRGGLDGPYGIRNFQISSPGPSQKIASLGNTQAYSASQFGGPPPRLIAVSHPTVHLGEQVLFGVEGARTNFRRFKSTVTITPPLSADPASVTDLTHLSFRLRVEKDATLGPRSITVTTEEETVSLENAFTVAPSPAPPRDVVQEAEPTPDSLAEVSPDQYAKLTGRVRERLVDENGDGLAEALALDVEIAVVKAGNYHATAG